MSTMTAVSEIDGGRPVVSVVWSEAGFDRHDAAAWRQAGWVDPAAAARWRAAAPGESADHLGRVRDAGYSVDQVRHTARRARRHVAAWAVAILPPAERAVRGLRDRPLVAPQLVSDTAIIDLR
ncbi:MAG: hypothetical protein ACJ739_08305 [Acidimicrobiales bacterium]